MLYISEKVLGKWNKNKYIVLSKLGEGGIGFVYKVRDETGCIKALKISKDISSITREFDIMNTLKSLKNIPKAYEIDDYIRNGENFHFIIMEYIDGYSIKDLMKHKDMKVKEIIGIGIVLLNLLEIIYNIGYIYGDIKPENIMIDKKDRKVVFIDFGGVIKKGQGIREFTPAYSMVSWGANEKYEYNMTSLNFSIAMIIIAMMLKKEFNPMIHSIDQVIQQIKLLLIDDELKKTLIHAIKCEINQVYVFKEKLNKALRKCSSSLVSISKSNTKISTKKYISIIDIFFILSMGLFFITIVLGFNIFKKG